MNAILMHVCLTFILSSFSWAKCKGFEDSKPSYCVKIEVKSELKAYRDSCIHQYELIAKQPAFPFEREYPAWIEAFEKEGDIHYMKVDNSTCEEIRSSKERQLKGISSQICYDAFSYELEAWSWLKSIFGFESVNPKFEFAHKTSVHFHDKGSIEVSCSESF